MKIHIFGLDITITWNPVLIIEEPGFRKDDDDMSGDDQAGDAIDDVAGR